MQIDELVYLGKRIKSLRRRKKLTLCSLCYRYGLEPSTVSRIEAGKVEPKYLTLLKLASALGITLSKMLDYECEK